MSDDTKLNKSIRAKLLERCDEYRAMPSPLVGSWCWPEWEKALSSKDEEPSTYIQWHGWILENASKWIHSCHFTPAELTYIHENLSPEAWEKLGLEVPETKHLTPQFDTEKHSRLKAIVEGLENKNTLNCGEGRHGIRDCREICGAVYGKGEFESCCCCDEGLTREEGTKILRKVLDAQLPPLVYEVPELNEKEREHLEYLSTRIGAFCDAIVDTNRRCDECYPILGKIFGSCSCLWGSKHLNTPQRAQIIDALEAVLAQQKPLLPPHNIVQFEKDVYDGWVWWLKQEEGKRYCPSTRLSSTARADCAHQCTAVFLKVTGGDEQFNDYRDCPCNRYSPEITRTIIEQCVALRPKFEEYPIWSRATGERYIVTSEDEFQMYFTGGMATKGVMYEGKLRYTKTSPPPKEEEFKPYVAVRTENHRSENSIKKGDVVTIIESAALEIDSKGFHHLPECLAPIPEEAYKLLGEMLGMDGMVERIKARCKRLFPPDAFTAKYNKGYRAALDMVLASIVEFGEATK